MRSIVNTIIMKKTISLIFILTICFFSFAQVGIGTPTPNASAMLDIESTESGLLIPRMTEAERDAIVSPEKSLIIYQTDVTEGFYYFDGTAWIALGGASTADADWTIVGNDMYNANSGNVGIGTTTPTGLVHIQGTTIVGNSAGPFSNTLYTENFDGQTVGGLPTSGTGLYTESNSSTKEQWIIQDTDGTYITCSSCTGNWAEIEYDRQTNILVSEVFTPSSTDITELDINFDYFHNWYFGKDSYLKIYLYNETKSSEALVLKNIVDADEDGSYSGSFLFDATNLNTDSYSLKFEFDSDESSGAFGASIDNIIVIENGTRAAVTGSYVFRLEDGEQQPGYVLTSDSDGNATWKPAPTGITVVPQTLNLTGSTLSISSGNSVDLSSLNLDVQKIDELSFNSTTNELSLSLENDGEAPQTVDLSDLVGTDEQTIDKFSLSGNTLSLSLENDGEADKTVNLSSITSGLFNFTNGLTESGGTVKLGGALTENTTITSGTGSFDLKFVGDSREIFETNTDEGYIEFGGNGNNPYGSGNTTDGDNSTMTDSGGRTYTVDFVAGFHSSNGFGNGTSGGSAVQVGSIEYLVDGLGELFSNSSLSPLEDNQYSAGTPAKRWSTIYATGGVSTTSDMNLKTNVRDLTYGLDEILKLRTITYQWKKNSIGKTKIPSNLKERKIGFSAQQLLEVLPETVETHSWLPNGNGTYKRVKNKNLGVFYSDIIPVTVKAIQEQQEQIDDLKARAIQLMKEIESLKK
jgi:hypothetical protein